MDGMERSMTTYFVRHAEPYYGNHDDRELGKL